VRKDDFQELDRNTVSADNIRPHLMNSIVKLKRVDKGFTGLRSEETLGKVLESKFDLFFHVYLRFSF
jgi:hypothetical protein